MSSVLLRKEFTNKLVIECCHHSPVDTNLPEPRPWTFSRPTGKDSVGNTTYSFSRIDDILLPTALANTCKPSQTCDLGYLSDHARATPILAIVPTSTLNLRIPHIVKAQAKKLPNKPPLFAMSAPQSS